MKQIPLKQYLDKIASNKGSDLKVFGGNHKYELLKIDKHLYFNGKIVLFKLFHGFMSSEKISE